MTTTKRKPIRGLSARRFADNPEERAFAEAWDRMNECGTTLAYLLNPSCGSHRPEEPSDRDHIVAATVVQWLGSPVGQGFLRDLGWEKQAVTK